MPRAGKIAIGVIVVLMVVFSVASYAFDRHLLTQTYARADIMRSPFLLTDADVAADYPSEPVEFEMDGATLRGRVYSPAGDAKGFIVFRHGIFSHRQDYLALITSLVDKGWKVFAYNALGCGDSDGDSTIGFAQSPRDVHAATVFARENGLVGDLPVVLVGHSWGGYGVAGALDYNDGVKACVSLSGFDTPNEIIMEAARTRVGPLAQTQLPFINLIGLIDFGADGNRSAVRAIDRSGIPVLVVHGTGDQVISYDGSSIIADRDAISNPHVEYLTENEPGRDGHNTYFYSRESQEYLEQCTHQYGDLEKNSDGSVSEEERTAFVQSVDKRRANTADPELMDSIDRFLSDAVGVPVG